MTAEESIKILKALGEETRIKIFEMLRGGKLCGCKLLDNFNITQPTLSHHMKVLCDCGLVIAEKDWKWTYYSIDCVKLNDLLDYLGHTACNAEKNNCKNKCD